MRSGIRGDRRIHQIVLVIGIVFVRIHAHAIADCQGMRCGGIGFGFEIRIILRGNNDHDQFLAVFGTMATANTSKIAAIHAPRSKNTTAASLAGL